MALGRVPGSRQSTATGVALLGLIVLLASGDLTLNEAGPCGRHADHCAALRADDHSRRSLRSSGFYGVIADRITHAARNPKLLLATIVLIAVPVALGAPHQ